MSLQNNRAIGFDGSPTGGQVPTRLVVDKGQTLTKDQMGGVKQAYMKFSTGVKLSIAPNHKDRAVLPDGTVVEMTSKFGVDEVRVWPPSYDGGDNRPSGIGVFLTDLDGGLIPELTYSRPGTTPGTFIDEPQPLILFIRGGSWGVKKKDSFVGGQVMWIDDSRKHWFSVFGAKGWRDPYGYAIAEGPGPSGRRYVRTEWVSPTNGRVNEHTETSPPYKVYATEGNYVMSKNSPVKLMESRSVFAPFVTKSPTYGLLLYHLVPNDSLVQVAVGIYKINKTNTLADEPISASEFDYIGTNPPAPPTQPSPAQYNVALASGYRVSSGMSVNPTGTSAVFTMRLATAPYTSDFLATVTIGDSVTASVTSTGIEAYANTVSGAHASTAGAGLSGYHDVSIPDMTCGGAYGGPNMIRVYHEYTSSHILADVEYTVNETFLDRAFYDPLGDLKLVTLTSALHRKENYENTYNTAQLEVGSSYTIAVDLTFLYEADTIAHLDGFDIALSYIRSSTTEASSNPVSTSSEIVSTVTGTATANYETLLMYDTKTGVTVSKKTVSGLQWSGSETPSVTAQGMTLLVRRYGAIIWSQAIGGSTTPAVDYVFKAPLPASNDGYPNDVYEALPQYACVITGYDESSAPIYEVSLQPGASLRTSGSSTQNSTAAFSGADGRTYPLSYTNGSFAYSNNLADFEVDYARDPKTDSLIIIIDSTLEGVKTSWCLGVTKNSIQTLQDILSTALDEPTLASAQMTTDKAFLFNNLVSI